MRVLFDVRYANFQYDRGIGIYIKNLLSALALDSRLHLTLLIDPEHLAVSELQTITHDALRGRPANDYDFFCMPSYFPDCWAGRPDRLEIILPYEVIRTCRAVVGIGHDLIPLIFPELYFRDDNSLKSLTQLGVSIASKISCHTFAVSQSTADDFVRLGVCDSEQVTVIGGGVDTEKWGDGALSSPKANHILYVGGDDARKNLDGAVRGFAEFRKLSPRHDSTLVIIGKYSDKTRSRIAAVASKVGVESGTDLIFAGFLDERALISLVQGARASIFPSLYEGLGLPILESYAAGTPVAASNCSSMRELVPVECQFDPRDPRSIGTALNALFVDQTIRDASLAFGRLVLEQFTWPKAAKKMADTLTRIRREPAPTTEPRRIAVFTCMPPASSGIANNSSKIFRDSSRFNIFTDISSRQEKAAVAAASKLSVAQCLSIMPAASFPDVHELAPFAGCLFVLGNSHHNLFALQAAIRTRGMNISRSIYLHDGRLENLWFWYCKRNMQRLIQLLSASYLSEDRLERCHEHSEIVKCGYFGIRPLALLTGISHFIVNSERAKRVVEQELAPDVPVRVDVAYHSIDRISVRAGAPFQRNDPNELIIGHFGIPHAVKGTPKVLAAASILRETVPVRVLLAGWHAKAYLEHNVVPADRDHIILVDAPSDEELFRCMKWVDVAVQLREENYGESSGIVAQLIGVGKKPITTVNLIDESMIGRAIPVPNDIEPKDLARVITKSISRCTHEDDLSGVSSEKLGVLVSRLVLAGHDRS